MGKVPTTDNKVAEALDSVLKTAETIGDAAAESAAIAYLPFLGWPVVKQVFEMILHYVSGETTKAIELPSTFLIIKFETMAEKNTYLAKIDSLEKAQSAGNPQDISAAEKAWADATSSLIHSDGSAQPK